MLNYMEFYGDGFGRKSKESKEIDPSGRGKFAEIRRRSHWPRFCLRHRTGSNGFEWVAVLPIGSVRKAAKYFFQIFSPYGADSPFQTYRTHRKVDSSLYI